MMIPGRHQRRSVRLKDYDYASPGAYFVTLCTWRRELLFGSIVDGVMDLSDIGKIVAEEWQKTAVIREEIRLDEWAVMPNHMHAVVWIARLSAKNDDGHENNVAMNNDAADNVGAHGRAPLRRKPRSLGSLVAGFKSAATTRSNTLRVSPGVAIWQRGFYEHVVRNERELAAIRQYIRDNPLKWALDRDNRANTRRLAAPIAMAEYLQDIILEFGTGQ
jgi:putative transposase